LKRKTYSSRYLEILGFHPVMCTGEPSFEIRKHPMNVGRHEMGPLQAANNPFVMVVPLPLIAVFE
jgi:hypothetical protein